MELESQPMRWLSLEPWFLLGGILRIIKQLHNYEIINLSKVYTYLLLGSLNQQLSCCSINIPPYLFSSTGQFRNNLLFALISLSLKQLGGLCYAQLLTALQRNAVLEIFS